MDARPHHPLHGGPRILAVNAAPTQAPDKTSFSDCATLELSKDSNAESAGEEPTVGNGRMPPPPPPPFHGIAHDRMLARIMPDCVSIP